MLLDVDNGFETSAAEEFSGIESEASQLFKRSVAAECFDDFAQVRESAEKVWIAE